MQDKMLSFLSGCMQIDGLTKDYVANMLYGYGTMDNLDTPIVGQEKEKILNTNGYTNGITEFHLQEEDFDTKKVINFTSRPVDCFVKEDPVHTVFISSDNICVADNFGIISDILVQSNINAKGKIATVYRNPSITIGVSNTNDLFRLLNGLKNPKLTNCLSEKIPFLDGEEGIAYLLNWDDSISYVDVLANYITSFVNYKKENNITNYLSLEEFIFFLKNSKPANDKDKKRVDSIVFNLETYLEKSKSKIKYIE